MDPLIRNELRMLISVSPVKESASTNGREFSCICPVIGHEFRHNIVKVAVDPRGDSRVDLQ